MRTHMSLPIILLLAGLVNANTDSGAPQRLEQETRSVAHTDTVFTPTCYDTLEQWQARRDWLRDQVRLAAGLVPELPRTPLNAKVFGKLVRDGYTIEKAYFESSPGIYVTGNLYRPTSAAGRCAAVACPHGHWAQGRLHHDDLGSIPARCITLARAGAVVFAYDMVGYNDGARKFAHRDPQFETPATALWGIGHLQLQTLNSIRVIDFLQSLPDVDPQRIGVTGASGGGTQTFILGAVDDRVTVDCPVNMISSTMQGGCVCENAPLLRIGTNNMEIAALFAPRPRLMVSATGDWTKLTPTVEYPFVRSIYDLYGASDRIANVHVDAPHNYNRQSREAMYQFFARRLLNHPHPEQVKEGDIPQEKPEDMLVFNDANAPADLLDAATTAERLKLRIAEQVAGLRPVNGGRLDELNRLVRLWLEHAMGARWPEPGEIVRESRSTEMPEEGVRRIDARVNCKGRVVPELGFEGSPAGNRLSIVLCVDPDGLAGADRHQAMVNALVTAGHRVVFLQPFGTGSSRQGSTASQPDKTHKFFTTFNPTETAEAVHDIIMSLQAATDPELMAGGSGMPPRVRLLGFGRMGPVVLLARAMAPERLVRMCDLRVAADLDGLDSASDASYVDRLFVPCIQRVGGLPAIAAVTANGPVWLHNTQGRLDTAWLEDARRLTQATVRIDQGPADGSAIVKWLSEQ